MKIEITGTLTGTRKGRNVSIRVGGNVNDPTNPDSLIWVRKEDGKPLFGTTGYFYNSKNGEDLTSYRNHVIVENARIEWD